jgi:hypothetical protein
MATAATVDWPLAGSGQSMTLGLHGGLDGVEHVAAGEVDGRRRWKVRLMFALLAAISACTTRHHVAAGEVVRLEFVGGDAQAGFHGHDAALDDDRGKREYNHDYRGDDVEDFHSHNDSIPPG